MTTPETKNAHPTDRMPTPDIRHSPQKLQQKSLGWACHKFEVDMTLPLGCNDSVSGVECQYLWECPPQRPLRRSDCARVSVYRVKCR